MGGGNLGGYGVFYAIGRELRAKNLVARIPEKRVKPLRIIRGGRTLMGKSKLIE